MLFRKDRGLQCRIMGGIMGITEEAKKTKKKGF
jgi:hypothetical protein